MKINDLISNFEIFITNEEKHMLTKLKDPVKFEHLSEREQNIVENMIRKSLVKRIGFKNPTVVVNEKQTF